MSIWKIILIVMVSYTFSAQSSSMIWTDPQSGHTWKWIEGLKNRIDAKDSCKYPWVLPSRMTSHKALNRLFLSPIDDRLPIVEYQLGGKIGEHVYEAKVFWAREQDYHPVYGNIYFVGAKTEHSDLGYFQPHVRDAVSLFSVICLYRSASDEKI